MSRKRKKTPSSAQRAQSSNGLNSFDLWLQRSAHLSQAFLTIFTLASLYFIVIPIYQKELLSEAIAQKELQLSELQSQIDQNEANVSNFNARWLIGNARIKCRYPLIDFYDLRTAPIKMDELIKMDFTGCINRSILNYPTFNKLTNPDKNELKEELSKISQSIKTKQESAINAYTDFKEVPIDFQPKFNRTTESIFELGPAIGISEEEIDRQRKDLILNQARDEIGYELERFVDLELESLMKKWLEK